MCKLTKAGDKLLNWISCWTGCACRDENGEKEENEENCKLCSTTKK